MTCPILFSQIYVRPDGKVGLCCCDALGEITLGDTNENSLSSIWEGERYTNVRQIMEGEGRYGIGLCRYCNHIHVLDLWGRENDFMHPEINWDKCIFPPETIPKNINLYIFGATEYAISLRSYLILKGYDIKGFIENESALSYSPYKKYEKFYSIKEIAKINDDNIGCLIVTPGKYKEIYEELQEYGIINIWLVLI